MARGQLGGGAGGGMVASQIDTCIMGRKYDFELQYLKNQLAHDGQ